MSIRVFHHVQLAIPQDAEDEARAFYAELLGLQEISKPQPLAARGGCWFRGSGVEIHLGVDAEFRPARKAHPALLVDDLDELRRLLSEHGIALREDDFEIGFRRFYADDPFGNRLEFVSAEDA